MYTKPYNRVYTFTENQLYTHTHTHIHLSLKLYSPTGVHIGNSWCPNQNVARVYLIVDPLISEVPCRPTPESENVKLVKMGSDEWYSSVDLSEHCFATSHQIQLQSSQGMHARSTTSSVIYSPSAPPPGARNYPRIYSHVVDKLPETIKPCLDAKAMPCHQKILSGPLRKILLHHVHLVR